MAKHVISEGYTFTPSTKTIVVTGKAIRQEQLLLITNTTLGTVIYNFSDPSLATSTTVAVTIDPITGQETTTIVLAYNTAGMLSTHKLSILAEEIYQEMVPAETFRDPVDKLRVSTPQSLIDTDFEYGSQPTKWEGLNLLNNRPSAFYDVTAPLVITNMTVSGRVVTVSTATPPVAGTPVFVQGTLDDEDVGGWWIVETVSAGTSFTFTTITTPTAPLYDATKTYVYSGTFFTGAAIPAPTNAISLNGTIATVTTTFAHGLRVGDGIYITGTTGATGTLNSSWVVATTPTTNTFTFACTATGTITATLNASVYARSLGYIQHRAFDGGVQFTNVSPQHGYQVIRQTRRQFRYQSGKAMQFSTGSIIKPALSVDNITNGGSGTTITVTTKVAHGIEVGSFIRVQGCTETAYNGIFQVVTAPTRLTFTYTALSTPSAAPATGFPLTVSPWSWFGSSNRIGLFDQQNGVFFEYDGQTIYCVKRSSTTQISGVVGLTANSNSVTGTNTKFSEQLKPGDYIVIRGMSYLVQTITSNTAMNIYPEYRGATTTNCQVSKTIDQRYAGPSLSGVANQWNIDKMDGTGSSLYNLDLTKMQMFYIDYSWYGAGAVRFGFKNNRGEVAYCHRIPNNNVNTEAYMRSGNLPARYETNTLSIRTNLTATLASGATGSMTVADTSLFPSAGTLLVSAAADTGGAIEYISYTGKTATTFTGLTRNIVNLSGIGFTSGGGTASATTFTFSATAPVTVESYSPGQASTISHWGSSVIMDGRYDDDKSLVFNVGSNTALSNLANGVRQPILSLRIAPSVDNGLTGLLGAREIINRMQLTLRSMGAYTTGAAFRIEVFLNGRLSAGTWTPVGGSSLAQYIFHTGGQTITGGENIFGFFTSNSGTVSQDLSQVRDIGNSILGGGTTLTASATAANVYPDGPDVITVCATNITAISTNSINSRLSWTEAQA
jgi:hypothetical protein